MVNTNNSYKVEGGPTLIGLHKAHHIKKDFREKITNTQHKSPILQIYGMFDGNWSFTVHGDIFVIFYKSV